MKKKPKVWALCLRCQKHFWSVDKRINRICKPCTKDIAHVYEPGRRRSSAPEP